MMEYEALHILAIDDDKGDRAICQRALRAAWGERLRFAEADSGEAGLAAIEQQAPDCVLLDHSMPGMDGIEVLRRLRLRWPYLPVVMIDGKGNDVIAVQSMKAGAQDYVAKNTISPSKLQQVVEMAMEHAQLQKHIHEQRASLEIFSRALAHDLKEPLRTICSFLDLIDDWRTLSQDSQQSFQYVREAAFRMNDLVDTVHLYTRLDSADRMEMKACDTADVVKATRENLAQLIAERGATIRCGELPAIRGNRVQLIQLFQNLIANAIKHTPRPVTIEVEARAEDGHWVFEVRDDGVGIERTYWEAIFNPFRRLDHGDDNRGSGLGLAISRKIVEAHGGTITCRSELGHGSIFAFTLPSLPAGTQALARLLLVDDSKWDLELNQTILVKQNRLQCEILTARDGREALATLKKSMLDGPPIDLVLLDINMPVMDGFELLGEMSREHLLGGTKVVMCTTSAYDKDERTARQLGAIGYLTKPPKFALLKDIIDRSQGLALSQEGDGFALRRVA